MTIVSLPALRGLSSTYLRIIESLQIWALPVCIGLPAGTSNVGTIAEAGVVLPGIMRRQKTVRAHVRNRTYNKCRQLSTVRRSKPQGLQVAPNETTLRPNASIILARRGTGAYTEL